MKNECVTSTGFPTLNGIHHQREHLQSIVSAITSATDPYRLLTERLTLESPNDVLTFDGHPVSGVSNQAVELKQTGRVCVVGGGKAAAGFAAGLEHLLGKERLQKHRVHGLVVCPRDVPFSSIMSNFGKHGLVETICQRKLSFEIGRAHV